eukprot:GFKZ01008536.1.p2 GENE.GFKZ01008536.1~~GFKZ01008536.1.p2  ORF type:complete len:149 (+),score=10.57 GFKZ01008536.1:256-702(+)
MRSRVGVESRVSKVSLGARREWAGLARAGYERGENRAGCSGDSNEARDVGDGIAAIAARAAYLCAGMGDVLISVMVVVVVVRRPYHYNRHLEFWKPAVFSRERLVEGYDEVQEKGIELSVSIRLRSRGTIVLTRKETVRVDAAGCVYS